MNGEIEVRRLSEIRVLAVSGDPEFVVLKVDAGGNVQNYLIHIDDLKGLSDRFAADWRLLRGAKSAAQ